LIRIPAAGGAQVGVWTAMPAPDDAAAALVGGTSEPSPRPTAPFAEPIAAAASAAAGVDARDHARELADLYRAHAPFVWRVLRRLGVSDADADDVCQEVFVVVHRKLPTFEPRAAVRTWLYSIAVHRAADHRRKTRRSPEAAVTAPETAVDGVQPDAVARRQALAVLDAILDELDESKRAVFVLYELEELPMAEVAAAVGCPLQTAYSRLHSARATVESAVKRRRAREGTP
jgi:RNA polymerase sigma-70 factor (ECF subfamily)